MPKLYFRYGAMNSSKTANLLMVAWNYRSQGRKVLLLKPQIDDRFGKDMISSRAIEGAKVDIVMDPKMINFDDIILEDIDCILVDEAQFLSEKNVDCLREITNKIPVICYGIRTDYRSKLFPGSKRLFELADVLEEIKTICVKCDKKAIINAKFYIDKAKKVILRDGSEEIDLGSEEKYQSMCWKCWSQ